MIVRLAFRGLPSGVADTPLTPVPLFASSVPPLTVTLPVNVLAVLLKVSVPLPIFVRLPPRLASLREPEKTVLVLLLPTVKAIGAETALLVSASDPVVPCSPPKVALESVPKLSVLVPLVSKVLSDKAAVLPRTNEPPLTLVVPV